MSAVNLPMVGDVWRNKRTKRLCRVRGVIPAPFDLVAYRYLSPPEFSRGHGLIADRTNTTERRTQRFIGAFEIFRETHMTKGRT